MQMKTKSIFMVSDPNEMVNQFKSEVKQVLQTELNVLRKQEKQNSVEYLTRADVADKLHCSFSTIHRMVNNGGLKCQKFGRKSLFRTSDVEAALIQINAKGGNYAY